jgi:hypothetical protein
MKRMSLTITLIATSFLLGFALRQLYQTKKYKNEKSNRNRRHLLKCKDPNKMKEWYKTHLGIDAGHMEHLSSGMKMLKAKRKDLRSGILIPKLQNSMNLQQRTL